MNPANGTVKYRVGRLEEDLRTVRADVKEILTNHLPHIDTRLMAIQTEVRVLAGVNILAIVVLLMMQKLGFL